MSKNENICPKCGALMGDFCELQEKVMAPYGAMKNYVEQVSSCDECGYEINDDMDGSRYRALYEKSVTESIPAILDSLSQSGYSMVATERILELPFRTLSRWKASGKPSSGGVALLRLLATLPWLLEVADNNYENTFAEELIMMEAAKIFDKKLYQNNISCHVEEISSGAGSVTMVANFNRNRPDASLPSGNNLVFEVHGEPAMIAAS